MKKEFGRLFRIFIGNLLQASGSVFFVIPAGFITGGMTGVALVLNHFVEVPVTVLVVALSAVFLVFGFFALGKEFALHSLACTIMYPLCFNLLSLVQKRVGMLTEDPALNALCAALCYGIGIGTIMKEGAASGGLDTIAVLLNRKAGVSMSKSLNAIEILTMLPQAFYSSKQSILCGVLIAVGYSMLVDTVIARGKSMIQIEILSPEYEKINETILTRFDRGTTLIHVEGGFKRGESFEIQTVVRPREFFAIKQAVLEIDPSAFVIVGNVSEVDGRGFTMRKNASEGKKKNG